MFNQFATNPSSKPTKSSSDLTRTILFVQAVVASGHRLAYGALSEAAKALGENASNQIPAQRGAGLVKQLPIQLQPHVCQAKGGYHAGISWATEVPTDLLRRPVIQQAQAVPAVTAWLESLKEADSE